MRPHIGQLVYSTGRDLRIVKVLGGQKSTMIEAANTDPGPNVSKSKFDLAEVKDGRQICVATSLPLDLKRLVLSCLLVGVNVRVQKSATVP